jgi:hypothetical protein
VINPDGIPQIDGDLDAVATAGARLQSTGRDFAGTGADVDATWQGLSAFYEAPESGQLLAATGPVRTTADAVGSDVAAVGSALSTYAAEVRPIQAELQSLRSRAIAFLSSIEGDDDWNEDGGKVDEHNGLLSAVNAAVAAWMDTQRRCANTINGLYGGIRYVADNGDGTVQANEFGYSKELLDGATAGEEGVPWGTPEEQDKPWYEDAFNAVVSFGEGLVVDGLWGTITGLGDLVGLGGWDAFTASWTGLGKLALALSPGYRLIEATIGTPGPSNAELNQTLIDTGKALIAYDTWDDDPARAAGAATFNVVSAIVGTKGAGAAAKAGTAARVGGAVASRFPRVAEITGAVTSRVGPLHLDDLRGPIPDPRGGIRWTPINGPGPLGAETAQTFRSATYTQYTLEQPEVLYRAHGGSARPVGSYWTRTEPFGPTQAQLDLALNPAWGNTATEVARIRVPPGTEVFEGFAAPQQLAGGGTLPGGGSQVFIRRVDPDWLLP